MHYAVWCSGISGRNMITVRLKFVTRPKTYFIIWRKAFRKTQLEDFKEIINQFWNELTEQALSYKSYRGSTTVRLVCCTYIKCLIVQDVILMPPNIAGFHSFVCEINLLTNKAQFYSSFGDCYGPCLYFVLLRSSCKVWFLASFHMNWVSMSWKCDQYMLNSQWQWQNCLFHQTLLHASHYYFTIQTYLFRHNNTSYTKSPVKKFSLQLHGNSFDWGQN